MRKKIDQQHVGTLVGCRDITFHRERGPYYIHICISETWTAWKVVLLSVIFSFFSTEEKKYNG
jgi:hypothetical protein